MKTKKYGAWLVIALLVALPLGFGACGGNGVAQIARGDNLSVAVPTESAAKWVAQDYRDAESGEMTVYTATADANSGTVAQSVPAAVASLSQRKLIKDLSARIETKDFEKYVAQTQGKAQALGGHVQSVNIDSSGYGIGAWRSASLVLRVPASKLEEFKGALETLGKVTSINEWVRDVTLEYTDAQAHIKALQTERDALLGLLEKADQLSDVLQVQEQLTKVRHELDSLEAQLRLLDDQIDLSTITLDIIEVERVSPDQPQGFWRQIGQNLKENLFSIGRGAKALFAWLISALPYFALGAVPAVVLALLLRRAYRSRKAKRSQKQ